MIVIQNPPPPSPRWKEWLAVPMRWLHLPLRWLGRRASDRSIKPAKKKI